VSVKFCANFAPLAYKNRPYWSKRQSGYRWGPVHRLSWDAGAV